MSLQAWLLLLFLLLSLSFQQCMLLDLVDQQLLSRSLQSDTVNFSASSACGCGGSFEGWGRALKNKNGLHLVEQQSDGSRQGQQDGMK
jgi:hypothetical protein